MKAVVFSLGCKVNECEGDSLISGLIEKGYEVSDKLEFADIYVVNTCAVTKEAERKSRQMEARIKKLNPNAKIIFTGCASQKSPKSFSCKNKEYLVTGTFGKGNIINLLDASGEKVLPEQKEFENLPVVKTFRRRAFIKVQDGCDNFCSYCIIPYLRGRSRSRNPESIIEEILAVHPEEAVLNGINLSAYDYGEGLTGLIKRLQGIETRIRLGSLEVGVITEEFLTALKGLNDFAPHFHLSLQSGADAVLKKMNRHYTANEFTNKCELIRKYFPTAGITTDIIAGFPTETERDFEDTVALIDKVRFSDIHPFMYSPREGTVAYKMKDLDVATKKRRLDILLQKKAECKARFNKEMIGKEDTFVPEYYKDGYAQGYTGNYLRAFVKGFLGEKKVKVKITGEIEGGVTAEIIENNRKI